MLSHSNETRLILGLALRGRTVLIVVKKCSALCNYHLYLTEIPIRNKNSIFLSSLLFSLCCCHVIIIVIVAQY